ncbi:MAG: Aliphatic sulfonates import ATP-binding protein SsuB [Firmicutes bacterium ADurb.Bin373]|nr:ABC transporter ATP-binding protein [Bacillota bacterium]OQA10553.1 MAG: Aliphatic sulfonates import ATP-binding protein SsuB [Firmicutes bacterium ADurb.Bin373]
MQEMIRVDNLEKIFYSQSYMEIKALTEVNLSVPGNEFLCILGPSGCGKSTLLRIIAGLETASSGKVFYNGQEHTKPRREIGMVFQSYSLMPWLTVLDNIALGLEFAGLSRPKRISIAEEYLDMIGMNSFGKAFPYELSGGMQQRVAIARALANNPEVLLMDEPFGALDAYTRIVMQKELLRIWEQHKKTILFVTHSVDEAVYLGDRIILMSGSPGRIKKDIAITMPRVRERRNPLYGKLTEELLALLEEA